MQPPVQVGILGCATVVEYALMNVLPSVPELRIAAVASRDREKARQFANRHNVDIACGYEELLSLPEVQAVYIPLPNSMHCEWIVRALEAGKAVLCEKPLTANAIEARRVVEVAHRTGGVVIEAFHWRYHPMCDRIGAIVEGGILGELRQIDVRFTLPRILVPKDNIRWSYQLGGGAAMDTGSYCVNFLRRLLGEPVRVKWAIAEPRDGLVDGRMRAELLFQNGCVGRIDASQIDAGDHLIAAAAIIGSVGELTITQPFVPQLGNCLELRVGGEVSRERVTTTATYAFQAQAFADVVLRGAPVRTSASDAPANMQVIDEIYRSAGMRPRGNES
jgi:predicted dehydrogenase